VFDGFRRQNLKALEEPTPKELNVESCLNTAKNTLDSLPDPATLQAKLDSKNEELAQQHGVISEAHNVILS